MSFADDLTAMIGADSPFTVAVVSGGTSSYGILDSPSSIIAGDQVLYTDYVLTCLNSDFGTLKASDSITVNGAAYTVRSNQAGLDGLTREISLQKT